MTNAFANKSLYLHLTVVQDSLLHLYGSIYALQKGVLVHQDGFTSWCRVSVNTCAYNHIHAVLFYSLVQSTSSIPLSMATA